METATLEGGEKEVVSNQAEAGAGAGVWVVRERLESGYHAHYPAAWSSRSLGSGLELVFQYTLPLAVQPPLPATTGPGEVSSP